MIASPQSCGEKTAIIERGWNHGARLPSLRGWRRALSFGGEIMVPAQMTKEERLHRMRHSAAHIMAEAVLEMFPEAKFAIGPPIENGFYYDFDLPRALTPEDLPEIEERMRKRMKATWRSSTARSRSPRQ